MKAFTIAWKDVLIRMRDRSAMILMLLAPMLISALMGVALGGAAVNTEPLHEIPVMVVNEDEGTRGTALTEALLAEPGNLLKPVKSNDLVVARQALETGATRAVLNIPRNFSTQSQQPNQQPDSKGLVLYVSSTPGERSSTIVRDVVTRIASQPPSGGPTGQSHVIETRQVPVMIEGNQNPFAFFAPSMAIFFLMISMFEAPRSILIEREDGTLGRLIRTPTAMAQILLGKMGGAFLTGLLQFSILVVASTLVFNLKWSSSIVALVLMVAAVVVAAASMGALIAAFSKDLLQAGAIGGAIALVSAGLGGNFFDLERAPFWLEIVSRLTINRWALEGFTNLTVRGLGLKSILPNFVVLIGIALVMFTAAFWKFQRRLAG
jgi:linearmycin/streptolysin S transport system permease protein